LKSFKGEFFISFRGGGGVGFCTHLLLVYGSLINNDEIIILSENDPTPDRLGRMLVTVKWEES